MDRSALLASWLDLAQSSLTSFIDREDPWCLTSDSTIWTGVDFSPCSRLKFLLGQPALIFLFLLLGSWLLPLIGGWYHKIQSQNSLDSNCLNKAISPGPISLDDSAYFDSNQSNQSSSVSLAEDHIIALEILRQGGLGIDNHHRDLLFKQLLQSQSSTSVQSNTDQCSNTAITNTYAKAFFKSWKDSLTSLLTIALAILSAIRLLIQFKSNAVGSHWLLFPTLLWCLLSILSIIKLIIIFQSHVNQKSHPGTCYTRLDMRLITIYLISFPLELLDTRSELLHYFDQGSSARVLHGLLMIRLLAVLIHLFIVIIELITPRLTTLLPDHQKYQPPLTDLNSNLDSQPHHSRPPPLEPRRSLISLAYFIHTDSYLWKHTFKTASQESIPDLRVDDKAASVLFRWKHDQKEYESLAIKPSLLRALTWHFRYLILAQQFFAHFNAVGALLPPFFMQRILRYISSKSDQNREPVQAAVLYASGMLLVQLFLVFSQSASLMLGRRLSVRLRALFISLVFTKGLKRSEINSQTSKKSALPNSQDSVDKSFGSTDEDDQSRASTGKIANLVANDVFSLAEICSYLHFLWPESAIQLFLAGIYLYKLLGYSSLSGIFCAVIAIPIQSYLSSIWTKYQHALMKAGDKRLGLATEVINNVKLVKFFAWERKFLDKMDLLRTAELHVLFQRVVVSVIISAVSFSVPIMISIVTFYTHTKILNKALTAEEAFTALALFNIFNEPLSILVGMISGLLQSYVSLRRIEKFLQEKETDKYSTVSIPPQTREGSPIIGFKNASFTYQSRGNIASENSESRMFMLSDLDFKFPPGQLSLVIGRVGSGKTTLLLSLLGETTKLRGEVFLPSPVSRVWGLDPGLQLTETTAYAPQQPWLLSDSIRNNILYGSAMNQHRYLQVLKACALNPDLTTFTDGDLTEIGEKGTVLSGGQKARISLARAVYSPAKVLLLDDVLSAVDSHTSQHLYENVLLGPLMKGRTCILVTHAVELCSPRAGFVVSLNKGQVLYAGEPSLLTAAPTCSNHQEPEEQTLKPTFNEPEEDVRIEDLADAVMEGQDAAGPLKMKATQTLIEKEHQAVGAVSSAIYRLYYQAFGGFLPVGFTVLLFVLAEVGNVASTWILRQWADSNQSSSRSVCSLGLNAWNFLAKRMDFPTSGANLLHKHRPIELAQGFGKEDELTRYIQLYMLTGIATLAVELIRLMFFAWQSIKASRKIYERLICTILNAKVRFFDTVPMGRLLNRLSKDVQTMDRELGDTLIYLVDDIIAAIAILFVIITVLPIGFLSAAMFACLLYIAIGYIYLSSTREIKRSESTNRSPVISLCTECLSGTTSIRAYGDMGRYTQKMFHLIDTYNRPFFMLWMCNRWLSCRIDMAAALFTFSVVVYLLQSNISAALAGFALSYIISFNTKTLWIVRWWSVNEINMNSLERIHEYLSIEQEESSGFQPPAAWPSKQGTIEVDGLTARYAPHLPPVLKSVSFSVKPGEKIGICGRTGSGKSTLALSFFRFIEAEAGGIFIDGLDISKMDLSCLRSRLTIIPQENVLFTGTIRWNLDPFSEHEDDKVWDALRRVGMAGHSATVISRDALATHAAGSLSSDDANKAGIELITSLEQEVEDSGRNFSTGQRQLLAIARAILKLEKSSILILDESTASLDYESDEKIQSTIRAEMEGSTILCIAHRLKTIIDYDKVLVLSNGEVVEFDSPWKLLEGEGSQFKQLCERSGQLEELRQLAFKAEKQRSGQPER